MAETLPELKQRLVAVQQKFRDVTKRLETARQQQSQREQHEPPQPAAIQASVQRVTELRAEYNRLQEEASALQDSITAAVEAEAAAAEAAAEAARVAAKAAIAAGSAPSSGSAPKSGSASTPGSAPSSGSASATGSVTGSASASAPKSGSASASAPTPGSASEQEEPLSNNGIEQYTKEHRDYVEQKIEALEKEIEELKKQKEETPEKGEEQQSSGWTFSGGDPPIVNEEIEKLEARIKELEARVKHLEENCCTNYTKSLIDKNKEKIAQLKREIQALKDGLYLYIFGEVYHTSIVYDEGKEIPYDGVLSLNALFRNYGLNRRYVNKDPAKDQWSRQYVDDVLNVFNKYFKQGINPYKVFELQTAEQKEKDSVLLCPHLKRRYQTIQWDIARETVEGAPFNPKRIEGVGHFYMTVWEDLDEFLRKTQICKGKISLPEKPLKAPSSSAPTAARKDMQQEPRLQRPMPTHSLPKPGKFNKLPKTVKAPITSSKTPTKSAFRIWTEGLTERTTLPKNASGRFKLFPTRQPPVPKPTPAPTPQIIKTLHLAAYLTNKLSKNPIVIEELPLLTIPKLSFTAFSLEQLEDVEQPPIYTTQLAAYITNVFGKTYDQFAFDKFEQSGLEQLEDVKQPPIYTTQLAAYITNVFGKTYDQFAFDKFEQSGLEQLEDIEQPPIYTTQLAAYITNLFGREPIETYDITNVRRIHLAAYLTNKLSKTPITIEELPLLTIPKLSFTAFSLQQLEDVEEQPSVNTTQLAAYITNVFGKTYEEFAFDKFKESGLEQLEDVEEQPSIYTTQLAAYITNVFGKTYEEFAFDKFKDSGLEQLEDVEEQPSIYTTQLAAYITNVFGREPIETYDITNVRTLHLAAYLTNKLNTRDIEFDELPVIEIDGIPVIYDTANVRTLHFINYLMNKLAGDTTLPEIPLIDIPEISADNSPPPQPTGLQEGVTVPIARVNPLVVSGKKVNPEEGTPGLANNTAKMPKLAPNPRGVTSEHYQQGRKEAYTTNVHGQPLPLLSEGNEQPLAGTGTLPPPTAAVPAAAAAPPPTLPKPYTLPSLAQKDGAAATKELTAAIENSIRQQYSFNTDKQHLKQYFDKIPNKILTPTPEELEKYISAYTKNDNNIQTLAILANITDAHKTKADEFLKAYHTAATAQTGARWKKIARVVNNYSGGSKKYNITRKARQK